VELMDLVRLHAEVLALECDVALLRTEHATSVRVAAFDVRLRDLHARLNACLKQLAQSNRPTQTASNLSAQRVASAADR
jgi:hypothetical protein